MGMVSNAYEYIDSRFRDLVVHISEVETLYDGCRWAEGPVWFNDGGFLVWSDIPNNVMMRWVPGLGVGIFRADSGYSNGNTRDQQGRLVTCEHGNRRVSRTEADGSISTLADSFNGGRLNSPNDVVVKSDGSIWFTDPTYGIISDYEGHKGDSEQEGNHVYRLDPQTDALTVVANDFVQPNGLAFSPDESLLYISDTGVSHDPNCPRHIRVFDVDGDSLTNGRVFTEIDKGVSDGFRPDTDGNIWTSAGDGVHCYAPDGTILGKIHLPKVVSNLTFGGPKRNRLFITATDSLHAVYVATNGVQRP